MFGKMFVNKSMQPVPPQEFWRAVLIVTNHAFANRERFIYPPTKPGIWDCSFDDAVFVIDRYLNPAILSGWLDGKEKSNSEVSGMESVTAIHAEPGCLSTAQNRRRRDEHVCDTTTAFDRIWKSVECKTTKEAYGRETKTGTRNPSGTYPSGDLGQS